MKRANLLGMCILAAPLAGCAPNPFPNLSFGASTPPAKIAGPELKRLVPPTDLESAIAEAQGARKSGDFAAATKILSQLVLAAPDDARVLGEYGKTLAALGRSDDALLFLERATQLQPADWSLLSALGVVFDQKGDYQAAQTAYGRALMLKPGEPSVLNNDALSHMQAGDLEGAEMLLSEAATSAPEFPRIAQNLALVRSLKAAQPTKPVASAAPAGPVADPVRVATVAPAGPLPNQAAPAASPVPMPAPTPPSAPVATDVLAPPRPPVTPLAAIASESPPAPPDRPAGEQTPSAIEILQADPTVRVQPVPKNEPTATLPRQLPARPEPAAPKAAENEPGTAPAAVKPVAASPKAAPENRPALVPAALKPVAAVMHTASGKSSFYLQAGSYLTEARAGQAASALDRLGARVMSGVVDGHAVYRVRIGPFLNMQQANTAFAAAQSLGHSDLKIVME